MKEYIYTRRNLLTVPFAFMAAFLFKGLFSARKENRLYVPFEKFGEQSSQFGILSYNVDLNSHSIIQTPFSVHLLSFSKAKPYAGIGANRYGKNFLEIDLKTQKVTQVHELIDPFILNGHMIFSDNGDYLCATATEEQAPYRDCIISLDPSNFKIRKVFSLEKCTPPHHDCKFIANSNVLVTSGGDKLTFIDLDKNTLTDVKFNLKNEASKIRHFSINETGGYLAQVNNFGPNPDDWVYSDAQLLFFNSKNKSYIELKSISQSLADAELLDIDFRSDGDLAAIVHGKVGRVSFWRYGMKEIVKIFEIEGAQRVVFDSIGNQFLILEKNGFTRVSSDGRQIIGKFNLSSLGEDIEYAHKTLTTSI
jgi:hypothetical protein